MPRYGDDAAPDYGTAAADAAPAASSEEGSATVRFYAPAYSSFSSGVEGVDEITHEGTDVPADKAEAVREAAAASNFNLMEG